MERFGRRPYLAELFFALEGVVSADVGARLADDFVPAPAALLSCVPNVPIEHIDPGQYEGALDGESDDFLIFPRDNPTGRPIRETVVVRGEVIPSDDRNILCRYSILSPAITDKTAHALVRQCVLQDLMDYNVIDGGLTIRFDRRA